MPPVEINESAPLPPEFVTYIEKYINKSQIAFTRTVDVVASADKIFYFLLRLSGEYGWYTFEWMPKLRRFFSNFLPSLKKVSKELEVGNEVGPFAVEEIENNKYLILKFTDKMLKGVFTFYLEPVDDKITRVYAATRFNIKISAGRYYWIFVKPFDKLLQYRMLANIKRLAEKLD